MIAHLVWFSYALDAEPLKQSVICAQRTFPPRSKFHVFDECGKEMDEETVAWLQAQGVRYVVTTFNRNGNLNGTSSVLGELAAFMSCTQDPDDVIWKTDCDTSILRPSVMLEPFQRDPNLLGAGIEMPGHGPGWWGPSYAFRREVLDWMEQDFQRIATSMLYPEDIAMSTWLLAAAKHRTRTLTTTKQGGAYAWYRWDSTRVTLADYAKMFAIVTFGARHFMQGRWTASAKRLRQAAAMHIINESL